MTGFLCFDCVPNLDLRWLLGARGGPRISVYVSRVGGGGGGGGVVISRPAASCHEGKEIWSPERES